MLVIAIKSSHSIAELKNDLCFRRESVNKQIHIL